MNGMNRKRGNRRISTKSMAKGRPVILRPQSRSSCLLVCWDAWAYKKETGLTG